MTSSGTGSKRDSARFGWALPVYLLSNLLRCGACGGGFSKVSLHHYGCSNARNRGLAAIC